MSYRLVLSATLAALAALAALVAACASARGPEVGEPALPPFDDCHVEVLNRTSGPLEISTTGERRTPRGTVAPGGTLSFVERCALGRITVVATGRSSNPTPDPFAAPDDRVWSEQTEVRTVTLRPGEVARATFTRIGRRDP